MAVNPMRADGATNPVRSAPSTWVNNVREAVRNNVAQQSTRESYYRDPTAYGGNANERPGLAAPPPRPTYIPPSALERWQQERDDERERLRKKSLFREFSDDAITSFDELLMPQFGLKANPEGEFKQAFEITPERDDFKLTPEQQDRTEATRIRTREDLGQKQNLINEIETTQSKDGTLPAEEKEALRVLRKQLLFESGQFNELDPLVVSIKNLGTRAEFRKKMLDWKSGKTGTQTPNVVPWMGVDMSATGEDIEDAGGLGGFLQQSTSSKAGNFDGTPDQFGYLIHTDNDGVDHIIRAEEWMNLKLADLTPAPGDTREELDRKAAGAADLIATLSFADKYNSFAKKRDAGYRIQLDADGNPVKAYIHNDDKVALANLVKDVMSMQEAGYIAPVEEFMKAYADERRGIAEDATGVYGDGQDSGGGYRSGGGGFYGGGYSGGDNGGVTLEDPELLKMSVDSIARARMGRSLTNEEALEFINYYHSAQAAFVANIRNGADATRLDPEAQAVAWIESKMVKESSGQQAGQLVAALMQAMRGGGLNIS